MTTKKDLKISRGVRIRKSLVKRIEALCELQNRSFSNVVDMAVELALPQMEGRFEDDYSKS